VSGMVEGQRLQTMQQRSPALLFRVRQGLDARDSLRSPNRPSPIVQPLQAWSNDGMATSNHGKWKTGL